MSLNEKLTQLQTTLNLSDRDFAKRLGVSRTMWTRTRLGQRPIRFELLAGAVRAFPDLKPDVIRYLEETDRNTVAADPLARVAIAG